jgi:hypothetical protein
VRTVDKENSAVYMTYYNDRTATPNLVCNSLTTFFEQYAAAQDKHGAFRALHDWIEPR